MGEKSDLQSCPWKELNSGNKTKQIEARYFTHGKENIYSITDNEYQNGRLLLQDLLTELKLKVNTKMGDYSCKTYWQS